MIYVHTQIFSSFPKDKSVYYLTSPETEVCALGLTCVQDVWQDCNDTQLTVLTGLLHDVFTEDLTDKH